MTMYTIIKKKIPITELEKQNLIKKAHIDEKGIHYSKQITFNCLRINYEWEHQFIEVKQFINQCDGCKFVTNNSRKKDNLKDTNNNIVQINKEITIKDTNNKIVQIDKEITITEVFDNVDEFKLFLIKKKFSLESNDQQKKSKQNNL